MTKAFLAKLTVHNLIWTLDSYKDLHDQMLPDGTEVVYTYGEARKGAQYPYTNFFGLQYTIAQWLEGVVVTKELIDEIEPVMDDHFKYSGKVWNRAKWDYLVEKHGGKLPVRIKAVPEGTPVQINNVLLTIENTDPKCAWLTNALETVLQSGVWYATTVCTRSNLIVNTLRDYFGQTVDDDMQWLVDYYLHDFGQRACTCMEQAGVGGMAHLVNSKGTDTKMAIPFAVNYYGASYIDLCHSVPASEHSIQTAEGEDGEFNVTRRLCKTFPKGILSVVCDTYGIERKVLALCDEKILKNDVLARDGKFVIRPDSPRFEGDTPAQQILWIVQTLWTAFGGTVNKKGYKVLDSHVGVIYGDSLTEVQIQEALELLKQNGFAAQNCVYGCGGYLLQKLNRDTERFAFKASAQRRNGEWFDIQKKPADMSKASKKGRMKLVKEVGAHGYVYVTVPESDPRPDELVTVFENGEFVRKYTFDEVRQNARGRTL